MSKAFTRESDDGADEPLLPQLPPSWLSGAKNYITAFGAERLRSELKQRLQALELQSNDPGRKSALKARIACIEASLRSAEVVPIPPRPWDRVRFGARVTVRDKAGTVWACRIVGVDEVDDNPECVSVFSPIARALINKPIGERVRFEVPEGDQELEVVSIEFSSEQASHGT